MSELGIQAVGRKVMIEVEQKTLKTTGGIFLSDVHTLPEGVGRVVSVGRGWYNHKGNFVENPVHVGDRVAFRWFDAQQDWRKIKWRDKEYTFLNPDEIYVIVEKPAEKLSVALDGSAEFEKQEVA